MSTKTDKAKQTEIKQLETAIATAREKEDPIGLISALTVLGQAHLGTDNIPKALTQFEEGLELAQAANDKLWQGRMWGYRGICLLRLGNSHFAQISLYKSYNLAKEMDDKPLLIDALTQLGALQIETGNSSKAIAKLEQAMGLAMALNDQPRTMHLAGKLGKLFLAMSSLEKAVEYFSLASKVAKEMDRPHAVCSYTLSIGTAYLANEQFDIARDLFEEALTLAGELENAQAELSALSSLMRTYVAVGNTSMAVLYGDNLLRLAHNIGEPGLEIANLNVLTAYLLEHDQYKKSLPYLQRGLEIATVNEDWEWQLTMQERLGFAHYHLAQLPEAQTAYEAALETILKLQDSSAAAHLYGRLSAVLAEQNQTLDAIKAAEQALKLGRDHEDWSLVGEQQILLAFAYAEQNDLTQAIDNCRQAIDTYQTMQDSERLTKAEALLAELEQIMAPA